jgi:hypothetical protein
MMQTLES